MKSIHKIYTFVILFLALFIVSSCDGFGPSGGGGSSENYPDGISFVTNGGEKIDAKTDLTSGDVVRLPEAVREGYEFLGWYLNKDLSGNKLSRTYTYPGGAVVLYADWMPIRYNVYFESVEETLTQSDSFAYFGEAINPYTPVGEYYEFGGWLLDGQLIDNNTKMPSHDIVLTAVWNKKEFKVTLNLDGGSATDFVSEYTIMTGDTISLPTPTKDHSIFSGWVDEAGVLYTSHTPILKAVNLKAVYKNLDDYESSYSITYVTEGSVPAGYETYNVGEEFTLPIPTLEGFEFKGWYTSPIYYGNVVTTLSSTTVYDQTFYAKWNEIKAQYLVKYIYPNGTSDEQLVNRGEKAANLSLDSKLQWYLNSEKYDFNNAVYEDLTLYANFIDLEAILHSMFFQPVKNDISLPTRITANNKSYTVSYSSSDVNTLKNNGTLNPDHFDKIIKMTCTFTDGTISLTQVFDLIVPKANFSDLSNFKPVFAYVYAGSHKGFSETFMNTVDVVNLAFGRVTEDATISLSDVSAKLDDILKVRQQGIRVVLSIGGGGASLPQFSNAAATPEGRLAMANSLLELVQRYHFDGIDMDWEYPGYNTGRDVSVDRPNYTLLMATIYQVLKEYNPDLLVTAALPGGRYGYERYALSKVEKYLDYIHLMTYDFHDSQRALHHTALYPSTNTSNKSNIKESVELYVEQGVPINKIIVGCAFYGRVYVLTGPATTEKGIGSTNVASSGAAITYTAIYDYLKNHRGEYISYYDSQACAPSIYIPGENKVITYDSANSISAKCKYVYATDVGGIMFWENGEDQTDSLLQALYKGMKLQK